MTQPDSYFICELLDSLPVRARPDAGSHALVRNVTAAVISKPNLIVATVNLRTAKGPRLDLKRSRIFELLDGSGDSVRQLFKTAEKFVRSAGLSQIYLRSSSGTGEYAPHACHFKIETILQLIPNLDLTFVNTQSVSAWVNREEPMIPDAPTLGLGKFWDQKRRLALETAMFVERHAGIERYFSEGRRRHG